MATLPQTDKTFYLNPSVPSSGDGRTLATPFRGFADYKTYAATNSLTGSVALIMLNNRDLGVLDFDDLVGHEEELHFFAPLASATDVTMELTGTNANRRMELTIRDINGSLTASPQTGAHMSHNCTLNVLRDFDGIVENLTRQTGEEPRANMTVNIQNFNTATVNLMPNDTTTPLYNQWEFDIRNTDIPPLGVGPNYGLQFANVFRRTLQTMRQPNLLPPVPPNLLPSLSVSAFVRGNFLGYNLPEELEFFKGFSADHFGQINPAVTFFPRAFSAAGTSSTELPRTTYTSILHATNGIVNIQRFRDLRLVRANQDVANTNIVTLPLNAIQVLMTDDEAITWTIVFTDAIVNALFANNNVVDVTNNPISFIATIDVYYNSVLGSIYQYTQVELYRSYVYNINA